MPAVVLGLLALWLALTVVGFLVKALLWLGIAALIAFLVTGAIGAIGYLSAIHRRY